MEKQRFPLDDPDDGTVLCGVPLDRDTVFTAEEFNEWMEAIIASAETKKTNEWEDKA